MSIFDANGAETCADCGRRGMAERDRLLAENAKLRELVSLMDKRDVLLPCWRGCDAFCRFYGGHCERIGKLMRELGFEVES